ncbi:toll-like receptor 2 type-2 [Haliotis cracherodii]|uniref:toll-like receptor 2 type-2 n=1 Tax=Haliotis cracherodii TaxID=6455 RepID=UPI0039E8DFB9
MEDIECIGGYTFNNTNLRTLNLRGSRIILNEIDANAFAGCYGLQILDLGYNQLSTMNDSFFNQMFRDLHSLTYLSLLSTQLKAYCLFRKTVYVMLLGFVSLGVVLVAVLSIIYKCRWKLRYLLYLINHLGIYKLRDDQNCTYDGFVVYSPSDTTWIIEHLIPCMEARNALKLCIHERDFDVGGAIVDNIVESVETSRKILIVLSINTLQSEWCQFEMNLAQRRAVGGTHTIVVVLLSDIPGRLFSSSINAILEEHPCVIWPAPQEDETARDMFWEQLLGHFRS